MLFDKSSPYHVNGVNGYSFKVRITVPAVRV